MDETPPKNICRACLTETGKFQSIFISDDTAGKSLHISEMMMAFASVQVTLGDGLPEEICEECAKCVINMYKFKLKCEDSDRTLRTRLGKSPLQLDDDDEVIHVQTIENENVIETIEVKPEIVSEESQNRNVETLEDGSMWITEGDDDDDDDEAPQDKSEDDNNTSPEIVDVNGEKMYKCGECSKLFNTTTALSQHAKSHTQTKSLECSLCDKKFTRTDLLLRHKIAHAMKMEKKMSFEDFSDDFPGEEDTIIIKTEDDFSDDVFPCKDCDMIYIKKEELDDHTQQDHQDNQQYNCKICSKQFKKLAHLNRHLKIHDEKKPYNCSICNKGFVRSEQLNSHMNTHTGLKPHVCEICFKGFNQISNLKDHMRTHNGEKPFLCSTCGKGFNQLGNLRQHTIRHSGIKAHLCSTCGNGFASKGELSAHLRKHTGARPFVCQICSSGFTTSSSLTKHKRIHSGEKPYECEVCKMKFSRSGILARHKRTHTGEKPYVCKFCMKAFSQSNDLTSHLRIHTGEKPYICDQCGQAFRQSSALKTHKKTHMDRTNILIKLEQEQPQLMNALQC